MRYSVDVERPSSTSCKFTVKVPGEEVKNHVNKKLAQAQKSANIKGFRPGLAPLSVVKQFYGQDIQKQAFANLVDESLHMALQDQKVRAIGQPKVERTGSGLVTSLEEEQDLTYTATFEVIPEIKAVKYTGIPLKKEKVELTTEEVDEVVNQFHQSQAQLEPLTGGLTLADGTQSSRPLEKNDFADIQMTGGMVTDKGIEYRDDMKGNQLVEVGAGNFIPGFEDQLIGMRRGETKTFQIKFPEDYVEKSLVNLEAEFTVTLNEIKTKKLAPLDDEFAKQIGYENLEDLRAKAKESLLQKKTEGSLMKLRGDLFTALIERNSFDLPQSLIESEARAMASNMAQDMTAQGYPESAIKSTITEGADRLRANAERQLRVSLILESISNIENIAITDQDRKEEMTRMAQAMKATPEQIAEFYAKNPERLENLEFKLRQESTVRHLMDKAKIA